jgi:Holliday junction resolvase RusA-like endonuclease
MYKVAKDVEHERTLAALAAAFRPGAPLDQPLKVDILAVMPRPAGLCKLSVRTGLPLSDPGRRWHTSKPDLDNCEKGVLDALKSFWRDDSIVCSLSSQKVVAALNEQPHYEIAVEALEENP